MKRIKMFVIAGLVFMLGAGQALAQETFAGKWWRMPELTAKIKLTPQEKTQLDVLYRNNRQSIIDQRALLEKERLALEDSLGTEPLNEQKAFEQFKRVDRVRTALSEERFRYYLGVRKILGLQRFEQLIEARKNEGRGRWHILGMDRSGASRR